MHRPLAPILLVFGVLLPSAARAQTAPVEPIELPDTLRAVEASAVDQKPFVDSAEVARRAEAHYPQALRQAGVSGRVTVRFMVDTLGRPVAPRVERTSGKDELDGAALRAVEGLRYVPARWGGAAYPVWVNLPVTFGSPPREAMPVARHVHEEVPALINRNDVSRALSRNYPPQMKLQGVAGSVTVYVRIDTLGTPGRPRIIQATRPEFVQAAVAAVQRMRFWPASIDNRRVPVWVTLPIRFSLDAPPPPQPEP
jgi:TonB family protein